MKGGIDLRVLQKEYETMTPEKLEKGSLVDGVVITFTDEKDPSRTKTKPKKVIILSLKQGTKDTYGYLVINTEPGYSTDSTIEKEVADSQYLIKCDSYEKILDYDSYVNCTEIAEETSDFFMGGTYCGKLEENDLTKIWEILSTSSIITTKIKKAYRIPRLSREYIEQQKMKDPEWTITKLNNF